MTKTSIKATLYGNTLSSSKPASPLLQQICLRSGTLQLVLVRPVFCVVYAVSCPWDHPPSPSKAKQRVAHPLNSKTRTHRSHRKLLLASPMYKSSQSSSIEHTSSMEKRKIRHPELQLYLGAIKHEYILKMGHFVVLSLAWWSSLWLQLALS